MPWGLGGHRIFCHRTCAGGVVFARGWRKCGRSDLEAIGEFHHKTNGKDEGQWLFWSLEEQICQMSWWWFGWMTELRQQIFISHSVVRARVIFKSWIAEHIKKAWIFGVRSITGDFFYINWTSTSWAGTVSIVTNLGDEIFQISPAHGAQPFLGSMMFNGHQRFDIHSLILWIASFEHYRTLMIKPRIFQKQHFLMMACKGSISPCINSLRVELKYMVPNFLEALNENIWTHTHQSFGISFTLAT